MTSWIKTAYQRRFFLPTTMPPVPDLSFMPLNGPSETLIQGGIIKEDVSVVPIKEVAPVEVAPEEVTPVEVAPVEVAPEEVTPVEVLISDEVTIQDDVIFEQDETEQKTPLTQGEFIFPLVTFIVPTINRATLSRTLASIQQQTMPYWKAIIIFDGCEANEIINDARIQYVSIAKIGGKHKKRNTAGYVRNHGMKMVDTPWIGFVDDDDVITPKYVERLMEETEMTPSADVIVFRMIDKDQIIPPAECSEIKQSLIGISFAIKTDLVKEGFLFVQSSTEDYTFIKKIQAANKKIILSPYICYLVRDTKCEEESIILHYVIN
jgi:hypothetical protein